MVACDPVWLRRRPDQRQRSSLEKTFGLIMDGISVRKPFPLGSLVLEPRDRVTTLKRQHEREGDANPHARGSFLVCPPLAPPLIMYPFFTHAPHPLNSRALCICVSPSNYSNLTCPYLPKLLRTTTSPTILPKTQASSQRINRKPWHKLLW